MTRRTVHLAPLAAAVIVAHAGCVSDDNRGSRAATHPPRDARPESVVPVISSQFVDTDANGYRDSNQVIVYVFTDARYQVPIEADGSFRFSLVDSEGRAIREWAFSRDEAARHRIRSPVGPGFAFTLSLLDNGGDALDEAEADLLGVFVPTEGEGPIRFRPSASVLIGRVRQGGGNPRS